MVVSLFRRTQLATAPARDTRQESPQPRSPAGMGISESTDMLADAAVVMIAVVRHDGEEPRDTGVDPPCPLDVERETGWHKFHRQSVHMTR